jgi:type IV pilus assembly protein PilC
MTTFHYTAIDERGAETQGEIDALCGKEAVSKLRHIGLYPTRVREKSSARVIRKAPAPAARARRVSGRVRRHTLCEFVRNLATLQEAGLAILRSLRILEEQQSPGAFRRVIGSVADEIEGGASLSEAMSRYPKCFNRLFVKMVAAGEVGGVLDVILCRAADFMEKSERLRGRIRGAMMYPAIVMTSAFLIVMGLMTFVMPMFAGFLTEMSDGRIEMPVLTRVLMNFSAWLRGGYGLHAVLVVLLPFAVLLLLRLARRFRAACYVIDMVKLRLPVVRKLVYKTAVARWTRTLATLLGAGVPILDVLRITAETSDNEVYSRMLRGVERAIRQGDTFSRPIRASRRVDPMVANMIEVGEETGELDKMLIKVADKYEEQADVLIGSMMSLLEPLMILVLGAVIGTVVLAIYLPIIRLLIEMMT